MIAVAITGLTRLWLQQRREHKKHVLEDYRGSLERLAMVPLAQQVAPAPQKPSLGSRFRDRVDAHREERRAERAALDGGFDWEIDLTGADPAATRVERDPRRRSAVRKPRAERDPRFVTLFGRPLWRRPKEPWFWTYDTPRTSRRHPAVGRMPEPRPVAAVEGNLARSDRIPGRHSHMPVFAPPRTRQRESLDPARREAAKLRVEARRRTGTRLS